MKELLYLLHRKISLWLAYIPIPRILLFQIELREDFGEEWNHTVRLPGTDSIQFFPYIVVVEGVRLTQKVLGFRPREVKDPVNILVYGATPRGLLHLLRQSNPKWHQFLGSSYFLHSEYTGCAGWESSIAIKIDIDESVNERYHIRLFGVESKNGELVTLGAAHRDKPFHSGSEAPASWDEAREIVSKDLSHIDQYLTERVAIANWRGAEGDGKILILKVGEPIEE